MSNLLPGCILRNFKSLFDSSAPEVLQTFVDAVILRDTVINVVRKKLGTSEFAKYGIFCLIGKKIFTDVLVWKIRENYRNVAFSRENSEVGKHW